MLARENRLPATVKLPRAGFAKTELFSVKYSVNNLPHSRFAFVVRKSVDTRAVVRNRIKRLFRSCIESRLDKISVGYDMLFFLEKGIINKQQADLCIEIHAFLQQKRLIT